MKFLTLLSCIGAATWAIALFDLGIERGVPWWLPLAVGIAGFGAALSRLKVQLRAMRRFLGLLSSLISTAGRLKRRVGRVVRSAIGTSLIAIGRAMLKA